MCFRGSNMRAFSIVFMLISLCTATRLISLNEIDTLFTKFVLKQLTTEENVIFQDVLRALSRSEPLTSLEDRSALRLTIDCLICRSAGSAFITAVQIGQTDDELTETLTVLCSGLGLTSYDTCYGAISLNIPIFTYIIKTTPEITSQTFCGLLLQTQSNPNACPYTDPRFEWQVDLPPAIERVTAIPEFSDRNPLKVALITDAHIDPLYEPFGVADCDQPTCCRKGQNPAKSFHVKSQLGEALFEQSFTQQNGETLLNLELVADNLISNRIYEKNQNSEPAGFWGDYRNCDTPLWAYDDVIDTIKENHDDIDLVYYIGDTIDHGVWETSYDLINEMNLYLVEKIRRTFGDHVKVVPTIGNHETQPTNQFAPSSVTAPNLNTTWLYKALATKWDYYLTKDAKASLEEHGSFSILVKPGLRVISLNNNVAYVFNWWLLYDPSDSKRTLEWLIQELYNAESQGEMVHILAHIPPGSRDLAYTWTREYNRVVNRFSATIAAEFNGHTHRDQFKIFYSADNKPINIAWNAGGITAYRFYNLNYKIAHFNAVTLMPDNIINYVYNLTEANLTPHRKPHWFLLYDMKNSYELSDLSPSSMDSLINSMVTDKPNLLFLYSAFLTKLSDPLWNQCDDECKINIVCDVVSTVLWESHKCEELKEQYNSNYYLLKQNGT